MIGKMGWLFGQGMAAFAGGAVAATVASRLLPPLVAQAAGAARAAGGGDPLETLIADHRRFVALLTEMEQSADTATIHRTQLLLRLKRGLAAHALAEEDIVYPLLHDEAKAADDAKHLYSEHADIKIHLHALEQMPKDAPEWAQRAGALKQLIEGHARHEEEIDFPRLREVLDEQAMRQLAGHVQREKALIL
jgi:hemerythrin superfamily protein